MCLSIFDGSKVLPLNCFHIRNRNCLLFVSLEDIKQQMTVMGAMPSVHVLEDKCCLSF